MPALHSQLFRRPVWQGVLPHLSALPHIIRGFRLPQWFYMTSAIRRVALIDNPASGQHIAARDSIVDTLMNTFRAEGIEAEHLLINGPGSGANLAEQAIAAGCDTIIVLGGDGTVHEVLQRLAGTSVALGIVPMGTANALAASLGLHGPPAKTLRALLDSQRVQVPLGKIHFYNHQGMPESRYFTVAAGVGADALLMSRLDAGLKRRFGYAIYLIEAFRIWVTHPFPLFEARFKTGNESRQALLSQLLAVRIRSFGGVLGEFAPGSSLHSKILSLVAFKTRSRIRYLRFLLAVIFNRQTFASHIELLQADSVECVQASGSNLTIFVEADGEVLGQLPVRMEVAAETLTLLVPANARP